MIMSMTGYGKGEARGDSGAVTVEVRTVNHRFLDCSIRLPKQLNGYEREIEKIVRAAVKRGHIYVIVTFDRGVEAAGFSINTEFLRRIYRMLTDFAAEEGIPGRVDIATLVSLPDVLSSSIESSLSESLWGMVKDALQRALAGCLEMRAREGAELARDVGRRLISIEKSMDRIEKKAPSAQKRAFARARERLQRLLMGADIDETRWLAEAAIMAERMDFSEEIVRMKSHLAQFKQVLGKGGEVSKGLTFLLQEIHREATTAANKCADPYIIKECLAIKECAEKIREQVQNLE